MEADVTTCPECAETIKRAARVCKHCGYRLAPPAAPEASVESATLVDASTHAIDAEPVVRPSVPGERGWLDRTFDGGSSPWMLGCGAMFVLVVTGLLLLLTQCVENVHTADAKQEAAEKAEADAKAAEDRRRGFHCLSVWDGSSRELVEQVKARLRDPGSFEHIKTEITPADQSGDHHIMMQYRSRNGFGGMTEGVALGTVRQQDCAAAIETIE